MLSPRASWAPALLILLAASLSAAVPARAQEARGSAIDDRLPLALSLRCPTAANPHRLYAECVGRDFDYAETLTRDWAGFRAELRRLGVTPTASYTTQVLGNTSGGDSTGVTYAGTLEVLLHWNLRPLLAIPGLSVNVGAAWSTGRSLSVDEIGNVFPVQSTYTAPEGGTNSLTLGPMYLQQRLLDDTLTLAAGRLAPARTFATMPVLGSYVNGAINAVPGSLGIDVPSFAGYPPGVQWGAQGIYYLTPRLQVAAGIFNASRDAAAGADGGHDFRLGADHGGVLSVVQATYLVNGAAGDTGLPGLYAAGVAYDSSPVSRLAQPAATEDGNYSVYVMFQQMAYREGGPGSRTGLTLWGEVALAPRSSVSSLPVFVGGGLSYRGLLPGREADVVSLGAIYGQFSGDIPRRSGETVIEANYQVTIAGWLSITPDLQYVVRPAGARGVGNALVLGAQVAISF